VSWLFGILTVLALAAFAAWLVIGAVRRTTARQAATLPAPAPCPPRDAADGPGGVPLAGPVQARYLGTTFAPSTVRRVAAHGLLGRNVVTLSVDRAGLRVEPPAGDGWCVPSSDLRGARVTSHHAGKEAAPGSVLTVEWVLGGTGLISGFVLDPADVPTWVAAVQAVVPV
jgi:hypothetical protein